MDVIFCYVFSGNCQLPNRTLASCAVLFVAQRAELMSHTLQRNAPQRDAISARLKSFARAVRKISSRIAFLLPFQCCLASYDAATVPYRP
jgi:hypothetical protein